MHAYIHASTHPCRHARTDTNIHIKTMLSMNKLEQPQPKALLDTEKIHFEVLTWNVGFFPISSIFPTFRHVKK